MSSADQAFVIIVVAIIFAIAAVKITRIIVAKSRGLGQYPHNGGKP